IFHQRYSTNTFPQWKLAQPFRVLAHNGEINTLLGNVNWMKSHEARLEHDGFGRSIEDLKPIIQPDASDSSALDNVFELLVRGHRNLPMVKAMMIPEALGSNPNVPAKHRAMYHYVNGVMEPWDGPAAIAAVAGKWALVGLDRNGLRPMRYVRTSDELLIAGSEAGMVPQDEAKIVEKGRLGPGEMLAVDMDQPLLYKDRELKDMLAETHDYAGWTTRTVELDSLIKQETPAAEHFQPDELRRRQFSSGWSIEDLEMILHPMVEDGKEAVGSMGDDAPLAVLSDTYRGMHHYFRQNFSQVTNPPIDSLRERNVMTLRTRLGNLGNILDESPEQSEMLSLQSPIVLNAEFEAMRKYMDHLVARIDCTFDPKGGLDVMRQAFERICHEAEEAVRRGCLHIVLTDANVDADRAALPMILAAGCVHSYLVRQSLRTFTSLNVRSGECLDVHYAAVIIGVGATTVNPYLAEETIAARHARGLFGKLSLGACLANYKKALDDGLLKVMSKMGISVLSSYRGGCNFEAVGLSRSLVAEFFPGMPSRISGIGLR
ncbi:MAG TPA: glutamate synthase central domain-containing protein, partial [Reyranella sp.]|nr:glutamate synthase central domain-containing protein [Reyranella sp.]